MDAEHRGSMTGPSLPHPFANETAAPIVCGMLTISSLQLLHVSEYYIRTVGHSYSIHISSRCRRQIFWSMVMDIYPEIQSTKTFKPGMKQGGSYPLSRL